VGERSRPQPDRTASRWGKERGYCVVMGQKVRVKRPRVRTTDDQEVRLGSYEMFHRGEPLTRDGMEKLMLGLKHTEIRSGGTRVQRGVWPGEERHQRTLHRGQPDEAESNDGTTAGQVETMRVTD